jgi:hypothetical protein
MKKILIPVLILIGFTSCSNYYMVITATEPTKAAGYSDFKDTTKYYILRTGSEAFAMKNIAVSSDRKNVQCTLAELPLEHQLYIKNGTGGKMKYKINSDPYEDETGVLNEVHIYLAPGIKTETGPYTLNLENVQKGEIIEKDKIKTKKSHKTGTTIGVSVAAAGAAVIIIAIGISIFESDWGL